jgi:hypothetical protein
MVPKTQVIFIIAKVLWNKHLKKCKIIFKHSDSRKFTLLGLQLSAGLFGEQEMQSVSIRK